MCQTILRSTHSFRNEWPTRSHSARALTLSNGQSSQLNLLALGRHTRIEAPHLVGRDLERVPRSRLSRRTIVFARQFFRGSADLQPEIAAAREFLRPVDGDRYSWIVADIRHVLRLVHRFEVQL